MKLRRCSLLAVLLVSIIACQNDDTREISHDDSGTVSDDSAMSSLSIPPEQFDRIVELFNRGIGLMDRFQPTEAVKAFEEVVALAPNWTTGRLNLGIALLNAQSEESYARAEQELRRVISEAPDNLSANYALGMLLRHGARYDEAKIHFERALEIDPDDGDTHYQLGILIIDSDPKSARSHLESALEKIPHHESACYRLQALLRSTGEKEKARELLLRFKALKSSGAGVVSGMKYGEMGRYAEVLRSSGVPLAEFDESPPPNYQDIATSAGLGFVSSGIPGWPGELSRDRTSNSAGAFGPGLGVADIDGDGLLDLCVTGVGKESRVAIYFNNGETFTKASNSGIVARSTLGAFFGDYDKDGDPDLYLTCAGPNKLYRNEGDGRFVDVTEQTGAAAGNNLSLGAVWVDSDHDGDLDLYVANFSKLDNSANQELGAPNNLLRNNGDESFTEVAIETGVDGGSTASVNALFFDIDDDKDLDLYLINHGATNRIYLNQRVGEYVDATTAYSALADDGPGYGALIGDVDLNGWQDILLLRGKRAPKLFIQWERGKFSEDMAFSATVKGLGAVGGLLADLDLDGDLDLVLFSAGSDTNFSHQIRMNNGVGRFSAPHHLGEAHSEPTARGATAQDFNGDGSLELFVTRANHKPQLWRASSPTSNNWLVVVPSQAAEAETKWVEPEAVGLLVEVKTGRRLQLARVMSSAGYLSGAPRRIHFGLGASGKADYVRLVWPDATLQSELEVAANQSWRIPKVKRKPSSCPILFTWGGERFEFVTDFLGVGGVGFFMKPGEYAPPDPTEVIRIPPELLVPQNGRYLLRVAEPLEEVTYLDELHLVAYDHPLGTELYPDERFTGAEPFPTGRPIIVKEKIFPVAARDHKGNDVLDRVLSIDRRYADPPKDSRFIGYADDHWLELDFGDGLLSFDPNAKLILCLYGWVEYTYSHINYAAYQAGVTMSAPLLEVCDDSGVWTVAVGEMGFPAGLPRMMTYDISALPVRNNGKLRIRTNMEVFWDQVFVAEDLGISQVRERSMRPLIAELRHLGYPREYSPDGADPTIYDYHRIDHGVSFKNMEGNFTRYGDVRELLETVDDQFVVMARGEEIALEFDASELPQLPIGWTRTFALHTDGYCKDMDLYTAFPFTVDPLPYHSMENYPPASPMANSRDVSKYIRKWNTRTVAGR